MAGQLVFVFHLSLWRYRTDSVSRKSGERQESGLDVTGGLTWQNIQIYEGTNQIQRVAIVKKLLGQKISIGSESPVRAVGSVHP